MKLLSASSFYRKASSQKTHIEDGLFTNFYADIYGVTDGNSAAFSPNNPPLLYDGLTGAQMINRLVGKYLAYSWHYWDLEAFLLRVNSSYSGKNP